MAMSLLANKRRMHRYENLPLITEKQQQLQHQLQQQLQQQQLQRQHQQQLLQQAPQQQWAFNETPSAQGSDPNCAVAPNVKWFASSAMPEDLFGLVPFSALTPKRSNADDPPQGTDYFYCRNVFCINANFHNNFLFYFLFLLQF